MSEEIEKTYQTTMRKRLASGKIATYTITRKYKVKPKLPPLQPEQKAEAEQLVGQGVPLSKVARSFGLTVYKLKKALATE